MPTNDAPPIQTIPPLEPIKEMPVALDPSAWPPGPSFAHPVDEPETRHAEIARALLTRPSVDLTTERCIARHNDIKGLVVTFDPRITCAQLADMLRLAGLELSPTYGGVLARTIEQGKADRAQAAKRGRAQHYQNVEREARDERSK